MGWTELSPRIGICECTKIWIAWCSLQSKLGFAVHFANIFYFYIKTVGYFWSPRIEGNLRSSVLHETVPEIRNCAKIKLEWEVSFQRRGDIFAQNYI